MSKTPSDDLFRLVKSLRPAEKRYFRLWMRSKPGQNQKYLTLFETLDAMDAPNDESVRAAVYPEDPGGTKYPELKGYLYDLLLKMLVAFDEQHTVNLRNRHNLSRVESLYRRGLYDDCVKLLQKAGKTARQYEDFEVLLDVLTWEKKLAYTQMDVDFLHQKLELIHFEELQTLERLKNAAVYRQAFFHVYQLIKEDARRRTPEQLTAALKPELFESPDTALSHRARVMYYRTLNLYHYALQDHPSFLETGKVLLGLLESKPYFLKKDLSDYIATLSNLILACGLGGHYLEVEKYLNKLQTLRPITEDDRQKIHRQYFTNKFALCLYTGNFEEGYREMRRCQEEIQKFNPQTYETASFYFQYACICFGAGAYSEALDYLNFWQNQPKSVEREDLQSLGRILKMILHFELANTLLLDSLQRSASRFLRKKHQFFAFEKRIFKLIHQLSTATTQDERQDIFADMYKDMQHWKADAAVQVLLQTFDIEAWLESHLKLIPFSRAVALKRQKTR